MAKARPRVPGVEARAGKFPGPSLIPALYAIQERVGWLPREELVTLAREVRRPLYEIEGLISFYPHFHTSPPKTVALHVCHDLACWLRGADQRIAALRERYGEDTEIDLVEVSCLGRCDSAPAVSVDHYPANVGAADTLIAEARIGQTPPPTVRGHSADLPWPNDPYATVQERYGALRAALAGELRGRPAHRDPAGRWAAGNGRRRLPHRQEVGAGRGAGRSAQIRHLQRRRI